MSGKRGSRGNTCNDDVDGPSVKCKTTCTISLTRRLSSLTYAKHFDPWQSFLRCRLLIIALYLSPNNHSKQIYMPLFCIPCKNLNSTANWRYNSNGEESNDEATLKQHQLDWVREELQAWAGYIPALETKFSLFTWRNEHVCKEKLGWLWCEQVCHIWHSGISSTLCSLKCSIFQSVWWDDIYGIFTFLDIIWSGIISTMVLLSVIHQVIQTCNKQNRVEPYRPKLLIEKRGTERKNKPEKKLWLCLRKTRWANSWNTKWHTVCSN